MTSVSAGDLLTRSRVLYRLSYSPPPPPPPQLNDGLIPSNVQLQGYVHFTDIDKDLAITLACKEKIILKFDQSHSLELCWSIKPAFLTSFLFLHPRSSYT